ncbi:MAG: hypothetical protein ACKVP0_10425 [Pirellulaceae bacterium]
MMRFPRCLKSNALNLALALASAFLSALVFAQIPGQEANGGSKANRPYADGPLTEADFKGKQPAEGELAKVPFQAYLFLDITWSSQHRTFGRGRVVNAHLTHFEATAVSDPAKSWNHRGKKNPELLDHEQGHFDITQIHAQRLELKMRKLIAAKKPPGGTGEDESAAVQALNSLLNKEYVAAKLICDQENVEYDKLTVHGTALEKQHELRRIHQETLKKQAEEFKAIKKKK